MKAIERAILLCDAKFNHQNFNKHINKTEHLSEMGMNPKQYYSEAEKLSLAKPDGNIIHFKRKDGSEVKYDKSKQVYVAYRGDNIITFHPRRPSQVEAEMKREGIK